MIALATFARALADGAVVQLETTPPSVRMTPKWLNLLREQPERERAQLREVLKRAALFRQQLELAGDGPIIPYMILPDIPSPRLGACISCGVAVQGSWRCPVCLMAVYIALDDMIGLLEFTDLGADSGKP
jgi:hypothetical protein